MGEVERRLATTRLLTLTGIGGTGKTRLALQVATDLLEEYADGVWLVELAALSEAALVPQAVAGALHLRDEPGRTLTETLVEYLERKQLLLLLDNCEHLIDPCARLAATFTPLSYSRSLMSWRMQPEKTRWNSGWHYWRPLHCRILLARMDSHNQAVTMPNVCAVS